MAEAGDTHDAAAWEASLGLPSLALDGHNALLSPEVCADFDPDAFLLSRRLAALPTPGESAPGSQLIVRQDLFAILAELRQHSAQLSEELSEAINRDYRQFVGLASQVRREVPRIERLARCDPSPDHSQALSPFPRPDEGVPGLRKAVAATHVRIQTLHGELVHLVGDRARAQRTDAYLAQLLALNAELADLRHALCPLSDDIALSPGASSGHRLQASGVYSDDDDDNDPSWSAASTPTTLPEPDAPKPSGDLVHPTALCDVSLRLSSLWKQLCTLQQARQDPLAGAGQDDIETSTAPLVDAYLYTLADEAELCQSHLFGAAERVLCALLSRSQSSGSLLYPHGFESDTSQLGCLRASLPSERSALEEQHVWFSMCLSILVRPLRKTQDDGDPSRRVAKLLREHLVEPLLDPVCAHRPFDGEGTDSWKLLSSDALASSPAVEELIARVGAPAEQCDRLNHSQAQGRPLSELVPSGGALSSCYNAILSVASTELSAFVPLCEGAIRLLDDVVWPYLLPLLEERASRLFLVGHADAFHSSYLLTQAFLSVLVQTLGSPAAAGDLYTHPAYIHFSRRWPMAVYAQLRMRSIVAALEPCLAAEGGLAPADGDFLLQSTGAIWTALSTLWDEHVALDDLLARQWRSTLHIISRFSHWLEDTIEEWDLLPTAMPDPAELAAAQSGRNTPTPAPSRGGTPNPLAQQERILALQAQQDIRSIRALRLATDLVHLRDNLLALFERTIVPSIQRVAAGQESTDMVDALRTTLRTSISFSQVSAVPTQLVNLAVVPVVRHKAQEPLRQPRHIATQYRAALASASPPSASSFIAQFTSPLRDLFMNPVALALPTELKRALLQKVGTSTCAGLGEALGGVKETQASLRRLKKSNHALGLGFAAALFSSSASAPPKEEDDGELARLHAQMDVDLHALQRGVTDIYELAQAGAADWSDPAWQALVRIAKDEEPQ